LRNGFTKKLSLDHEIFKRPRRQPPRNQLNRPTISEADGMAANRQQAEPGWNNLL